MTVSQRAEAFHHSESFDQPGKDSGHRFDLARRWAAGLSLGFEARNEASEQEEQRPITRLVRRKHHGPLRVQRPFYPEGRHGCCHVYLLHPPGGLVSGDELRIEASVGEGAHALLTTPAAAKLYKADSHGVAWGQHTRLQVAQNGILEYLPQETLAFDGSRANKAPLSNWTPVPNASAGKFSPWVARPVICRLFPATWSRVSGCR